MTTSETAKAHQATTCLGTTTFQTAGTTRSAYTAALALPNKQGNQENFPLGLLEVDTGPADL